MYLLLDGLEAQGTGEVGEVGKSRMIRERNPANHPPSPTFLTLTLHSRSYFLQPTQASPLLGLQ